MSQQKRDAEASRARILAAARRLFAERDIPAVSIRDIARAAGVSHGLVQQYFGTREQMLVAIIQSEIEQVTSLSAASLEERPLTLEDTRHTILAGRSRFHDFALLITRAQLAGIKPETMLDPAKPTPATTLAETIQELQSHAPAQARPLDPQMVSAYVNAALIALEIIHPWLMASVGLKPEDYEARFDEVAEITMQLIRLAAGAEPQ